MIMTNENNQIILNNLIANQENLQKIKHLEYIYSAPNFEYGYLEHGYQAFTRKNAKKTNFGDQYIEILKKVGDTIDIIPTEFCTTKAKNTLKVIRNILGKNSSTIWLSDFFVDSSKYISTYGSLEQGEFNIDLTIQKLKYLLLNKKILIK